MREIRQSGSEGGAAQNQCAVPTPISAVNLPRLDQNSPCCIE
jgi:hypothetical protein